MNKPVMDPDKLFLTEFMVVSVLSNNGAALTFDEVCQVIERVLNQPRARRRITKAVQNLTARGVVIEQDATYQLASAHKHLFVATRDAIPETLGVIERDESDPTREYIPLPGGWEVQTKGDKGSSYRLLDKKTKERHLILSGKDWKPLQDFFTRFAHEVHAACKKSS